MKTLLIATRKGLFTARHASIGVGGWQITSHHFAGEPVSQMLVDARDGAWYAALRLGHFGVKLHRSRDQGANWEEIGVPALPPKPTEGTWKDDVTPWSVELVWSLAAGGADEPGVLWAGCMPAGMFRSSDHGATWQLMESLWHDARRKEWMGGGNDYPGVHSITVDPRDSKHVTIAISCGGIWQTRDGGSTWALIGQGQHAGFMPPERANDPNVQDPHALALCASAPDVMWLQHHAGIYRSTDGGANFSRLAAPITNDFGFPIVSDPENASRAWVVPAQADTHRYAPDGAMCVARTDDAGKTWHVFRAGLPQSHAFHLIYRHGMALASDRRTLAIGSTTGGVWISENAGEAWKLLSNDLPPVAAVAWVN
jgi:photosystem II stability/assembly factor-like uncharacterized protein